MSPASWPTVQIHFGPFTLDPDTRQLTRNSRVIHLAPKAFELLLVLVSERPKLLSKAVLQQRLWPDVFVAEANLSNLVAELRQALGDRARSPQYIRTGHGFGYAFCGDASTVAINSSAPARHASWLEWGKHRFLLPVGEHVVGRDPDVDIRLDAATVSRRHARFIVTTDGTHLEDFGSKNGTFVGSTRVSTPVPLNDGDTIRIGALHLMFHAGGLQSTETQGTV